MEKEIRDAYGCILLLTFFYLSSSNFTHIGSNSVASHAFSSSV